MDLGTGMTESLEIRSNSQFWNFFCYNLETLKKDKKTVWDGVHNNLALKHINNMKKGDQILFYHSGDQKQIVGIMEAISKPYPNPDEENKRFVVVDVKTVSDSIFARIS